MNKRVLVLLGLMGLVVIGSFFWHRQHTPLQASTPNDAPATTAQPVNADTVALEQEAIEAIKADNADLEARIAALRAQQADADKLIELKAARLDALDSTAKKP